MKVFAVGDDMRRRDQFSRGCSALRKSNNKEGERTQPAGGGIFMSELLKAEELNADLLFNWRWFTDPISPWVLREIGEENRAALVTVELELQRSIYQAKIAAVDKILGGLRDAAQ
jgi:hypothetical protein